MTNQVFAMTGGATGIGAAVKSKLRAQGDRMIVVDIKEADIVADLSTIEGRENAVAEIKQAAPDGLDGFVACAGLGPHVEPKSLIDKVNYFALVSTIEGIKEQVAKRQGSIVAVSSNSAHMDVDQEHVKLLLSGDESRACEWIDSAQGFEAGFNAYCGSKQAVAKWVRLNAPGYAGDGVRLNAIAPGMVDTGLNRAAMEDPVYEESMLATARSIPLTSAMGHPDVIADAILFMLSDASRFMAGSVLFVDGGQDAQMNPELF